MKIKRKIRRILFFMTVKSPILALLTIIISSSVLYFVMENSYISNIIQTDCKDIITDKNDTGYLITVEIEKALAKNITSKTPVLLYQIDKNNEKCNAAIVEFIELEKLILISIKPNENASLFKNVEGSKILEQEIKVKFILEKQSMLKKILKKI